MQRSCTLIADNIELIEQGVELIEQLRRRSVFKHQYSLFDERCGQPLSSLYGFL